MAESNQEYGTIIGADASFKGELKFESAAKVLGEVEGSINSKGKIQIAAGAQCKAAVTAKEVAVEGHIEGNVEATDRVELQPKGRITGDVVAARMSMADGASIDGHCKIGVNKSPSKAASSTEMKATTTPAATSSTAEPAAAKR